MESDGENDNILKRDTKNFSRTALEAEWSKKGLCITLLKSIHLQKRHLDRLLDAYESFTVGVSLLLPNVIVRTATAPVDDTGKIL